MIRGMVLIRGGARQMKEATPAAIKNALRKALVYYHDDLLYGHFQESAKQKYGYQGRTAAYERQKLRVMGHQRPLVWSARLLFATMGAYRITGSSKLMRLTMRGTNALNLSNRGISMGRGRKGVSRRPMPNMAEEIVATIPPERRKMAQIVKDSLAREMNAIRKTEVHRI